MTTIKFQIRDTSGNSGGIHDTLSDAVLSAAQYDGWGAVYQRDVDGDMRLYSSRAHIGNNPYVPGQSDEFFAYSSIIDDDTAIAVVAGLIYKSGVLHSRYQDLSIIELTYDGDVLTHIEGRTPEEIIEQDFGGDEEITVATVRGWYA